MIISEDDFERITDALEYHFFGYNSGENEHNRAIAEALRDSRDTIICSDELLEALEALLIWVAPIAGDNHDAESAQFEIATLEMAENAIAKAKGKQK